MIDDIEIRWAGSGTVQHFSNVAPDQFLHITEGEDKFEILRLRKLVFKEKPDVPMSMPGSADLK
jgi:hypothetical protein